MLMTMLPPITTQSSIPLMTFMPAYSTQPTTLTPAYRLTYGHCCSCFLSAGTGVAIFSIQLASAPQLPLTHTTDITFMSPPILPTYRTNPPVQQTPDAWRPKQHFPCKFYIFTLPIFRFSG